MPLPRVRFTVRRMMVAVAIVAIFLAAAVHLARIADRDARLSRRYRDLAAFHNAECITLSWGKYWRGPDGEYHASGVLPSDPKAVELKGRELALYLWHSKLGDKYGFAADHPQLVVAPDPPEPG